MRLQLKHSTLLVLTLCLGWTGCKKEEGPGGTSTIKGVIFVRDFDSGFLNPTAIDSFPAPDQKAYIIYGGEKSTYDDDYNSSFDGTFEFKHLQKGKYRIFAYSKDSSGASIGNPSEADLAVFVDVEIESNGSTITTDTIFILDNKAQ